MTKIKHRIFSKIAGFLINLLSYIHAEKAKTLAYELFSHPKKGKLKSDRLPRTLASAKKETFTLNSETLQAYIWEGNEKAVLLAHGWESNASRWKKTLPYLKQTGYTIVAFDAPAHGLSSGAEFNTPKYAEFLDFLTKKYHAEILIGHSLGGAAITYFLNQYQNPAIEKVALLGVPSEFKIIRDNFNTLLGLNSKVKSMLKSYYAEKFNIDFNEFSGHKLAENFSQKAFIAHDIDDKIVRVDEGRKFAQAWKNALYIETKGSGHSLHNKELYQELVIFITSA